MTTFKFGNCDNLIENTTINIPDTNDTVILGNGNGNEVDDGAGVGGGLRR